MNIKYLGHASFFVRSKDAKVVTDPFNPSIGIKFPKTEADIVTFSHDHDDHNYSQGISGEPLFVDWPGEYEKKGVRITGFATYHDKEKGKQRGQNTIFRIEADGVSILHCGDLGHTLDDDTLEAIGDIDVLLVPVGGHYTIDAKEAVQVIKQIEPSIIIPMHYKTKAHDEKVFGEVAPLEDFLKAYGLESPETVDQLTIKKEDLAEEAKVVIMNAN
jgi:L-ascorbate metabolism protein UlaG (beta-lactamase superfamily)